MHGVIHIIHMNYAKKAHNFMATSGTLVLYSSNKNRILYKNVEKSIDFFNAKN